MITLIFIIILITLVWVLRTRPSPTIKTMSVYNVTTSDQPTEIVNRNVADAYGQIYYSATILPNRKPDWADREIRRYEIEYVPKEDCPKHIRKGDCPPFGYYVKCNPGGCPSRTKCTENTQCGKGKCINGRCDCSNVDDDTTYECNVRMYPKGTPKLGDLTYVGAVEAPNYDSALTGEKGWWYSLPEKGYCSPGKTLGKDCTWRIKSFSDPSPTMRDLVNKGYIVKCTRYSGQRCQPLRTKEDWENNKKILETIFTKVPMKAFI